MGEWTITEEPLIVEVDDLPSYFYVVEDKKYARRGYLYKFNPPLLVDPYSRWNKRTAENSEFHTRMGEYFGLGVFIRPRQIRHFLTVGHVKCFHIFQWLCSVNLAERYIAGIIGRQEKLLQKDITYGVHYLLKDKSEQIFYGPSWERKKKI